jgi:hypothetical protein
MADSAKAGASLYGMGVENRRRAVPPLDARPLNPDTMVTTRTTDRVPPAGE